MSESMNKPTIIIGEGWAAAAAAGWLGAQGASVRWISGTGSRLLAPLPFLACSDGVAIWTQISAALGIETGEARQGAFMREFRNKGFRAAAWTQAPTPGDREEVFNETLWESERRLTGLYEERFENISLMDLEEALRAKVLSLPSVIRMEGASVIEMTWEKNQGSLKLASGEKFTFQKLIFADRWDSLGAIQGLPKTLSGASSKFRTAEFERKFSPSGALQLVLHHEPAVGAEVGEGFMLELIRETGDENQKHVFGGFYADGSKSLWTVMLGQEEVEDNHLIGKRLRRIKQALNKVFAGPEWIGAKKEFMATVTNEAVRLEESILFSTGNPEEAPLCWDASGVVESSGITFLTDGFGPSFSLAQVGRVLGMTAIQADAQAGAEAQAESVGASDPVYSENQGRRSQGRPARPDVVDQENRARKHAVFLGRELEGNEPAEPLLEPELCLARIFGAGAGTGAREWWRSQDPGKRQGEVSRELLGDAKSRASAENPGPCFSLRDRHDRFETK